MLFVHVRPSYNSDIQNGWGPLTLACNNGYISTVKLLIQRGADVNIFGEVCGMKE